MANEAGKDPPLFQRGRDLTAADLNRIVDMVTKRIVGVEPVMVKAAARQIVIGLGDVVGGGGSTAARTLFVELGSPVDASGSPGLYNFTKYKGSGPESGVAQEVNGTTNIGSGLRVEVKKIAGDFYFFFPIKAC